MPVGNAYTNTGRAQSGSKDGPYLMNVSQMRSITVKNGILVQYIQHPRIMILEDQMFLCIYGCTCCIYIYACNGMWQHLLNAPLSLATKFVCLKKNAGFFFFQNSEIAHFVLHIITYLSMKQPSTFLPQLNRDEKNKTNKTRQTPPLT